MNRSACFACIVALGVGGVISEVAQAQGTPAGAMTWRFGYDAQGNRQTVVDGLGATTQTQYDRLSRGTQITQPTPAAGVSRPVITQGWNLADQVVSITDPRNLVTSYAKTGLGDTTSQSSPDTGTVAFLNDAAGNISSRMEIPSGKRTIYTFDALDRLTQIMYPTGVGSVFTYDGGTTLPKLANSVGRLTKFTDESGNTSYLYDAFGHVTQKVQFTSSNSAAHHRPSRWLMAGVPVVRRRTSCKRSPTRAAPG